MNRFSPQLFVIIMMAGSLSQLPSQSQEIHTDQTETSGDAVRLPALSGPFGVGKVIVHLIDKSRIEPLSPTHDFRELMVDIWYPADSLPGKQAPYIDVNAFLHALGDGGFKQQFGEASDSIQRGVRTHAALNAPFAGASKRSVKNAPLLVFSPGGGLVPEIYTAQMEALASHGYIVAAICHPYDAILTVLPDGRSISYDGRRWPAIPSVEGTVNLNQLEWHTSDIRFVLNYLLHAEPGDRSLPFAHFVDSARLGAFGHSFGGIAAAHACQTDSRLNACLDEDGLAGKRPFYLDVRGWGLDQAYMLIQRSSPTTPPPDKELAAMRMTREQANVLLAELQAYQDEVLRSTGRGSYEVILRRQGTSHMDFTDLPLLGAHDAAETKTRELLLKTIETYTLDFFDKYVGGKTASPLERVPSPLNDFVEGVKTFLPAASPYHYR